ncbi:hypothetical protein OOZ15_13575 [Galbibacter sp. EGI 63066]|uniref:hypothetical protein n=1 Tax=Galbibacter sp. EGI 63066 TaxID=2993559 RepID=UPI0022491DDD|nr:hypothetical protein [Galbibacter sp. EGI 63066]MCX2680978.1 hypothetical protein [Galbibacter sp. EGI 63066]
MLPPMPVQPSRYGITATVQKTALFSTTSASALVGEFLAFAKKVEHEVPLIMGHVCNFPSPVNESNVLDFKGNWRITQRQFLFILKVSRCNEKQYT